MDELMVDLDALSAFAEAVHGVGGMVASAFGPDGVDLTALGLTLGLVAAEFLVGVGSTLGDLHRAVAAETTAAAAISEAARGTRERYADADEAAHLRIAGSGR